MSGSTAWWRQRIGAWVGAIIRTSRGGLIALGLLVSTTLLGGSGCTPEDDSVFEEISLRNTIGVGFLHSCARGTEGSLLCWGSNSAGQLGDGSRTAHSTAEPVEGMGDVVAITAGAVHTCVLRSTQTVFCWGDDQRGQLGIRASDSQLEADGMSATPRQLTWLGDTEVVDIEAGAFHTCATRRDGDVICWGDSDRDRFPVDDQGDGRSVFFTEEAVQFVAGYLHSCALLRSGAVECWGSNQYGELGDPGLIGSSANPVRVDGLRDAVQISAGTSFEDDGARHTCAVRETGGIVCWGNNRSGQLGNGDRSSQEFPGVAVPVAVEGIEDAVQVAAGAYHTCARGENGQVWCWGELLGDGTSDSRATPVEVPDLTDAVDLAAGADLTCARRASDEIVCWGDNAFGQVGDGSSEERLSPTPVSGL